jgi:hypothetical protein
VPPRILDSDTRGLLRRIIRRVRHVMAGMVPDNSQIQWHHGWYNLKLAGPELSLRLT